MERRRRPTWAQLVKREPRLADLRLVGWSAAKEDPVLRSGAAYDAAYETLYALLPDCRNCLCL